MSIPDGVSAILGDGLPFLLVIVVPLVAIPPSFDKGKSSSLKFKYPRPYPKTPKAGITGFLKSTPQILTDKSAITK